MTEQDYQLLYILLTDSAVGILIASFGVLIRNAMHWWWE